MRIYRATFKAYSHSRGTTTPVADLVALVEATTGDAAVNKVKALYKKKAPWLTLYLHALQPDWADCIVPPEKR